MFLFPAIIAASVFAVVQNADSMDIYARLGVPKMETCDYRIHVEKDGKWMIHLTQAYSIEGVTSEDLHDFEELLITEAKGCGAQSFTCSAMSENRRQCVCKGRSNDLLKLASLLVHVFEEGKCDFFRLYDESFDWKFLRDDKHSSSPDEKKAVSEFVTGLAVGSFLGMVIDEEFRRRGVTQAELESSMDELVKSRLVLTTDGKITADLPAEVSDDGKTMALNLSKFLSGPPEKWSIRIDRLGRKN